MPLYAIRHLTRFRYSEPISQSLTEVRMQPLTEGGQRCLAFSLRTSPKAEVLGYRDHWGNLVHHFDVPGRHNQLTITAEATVEVTAPPPLPVRLEGDAWATLDAMTAGDEYYDLLQPSAYATAGPLLDEFARDLRLERGDDPLTSLLQLTADVYDSFAYVSQSTSVHSSIDDALRGRQGVCQDFTHVMIALGRRLGIPCRYVSGYLFHRVEDDDRSAADATHAWVEAALPEVGWVGFDPTNNVAAGERHIRVAIGRDYADVPPTRGTFKGRAESTLEVGVQVTPTAEPPPLVALQPVLTWAAPAGESDDDEQDQQQQQ